MQISKHVTLDIITTNCKIYIVSFIKETYKILIRRSSKRGHSLQNLRFLTKIFICIEAKFHFISYHFYEKST